MGDSATAGNAALARTVLGLIFVDYRGVSWSIGGDGTIKSRKTFPNILKQYNPSLIGYSVGTDSAFFSFGNEHLNVAVSGKSVPVVDISVCCITKHTLSVKTSSAKSDEIFIKWRKFLPTKILADENFHRRIIFTDEYFLPTKISKLYYSAIILAVNRNF